MDSYYIRLYFSVYLLISAHKSIIMCLCIVFLSVLFFIRALPSFSSVVLTPKVNLGFFWLKNQCNINIQTTSDIQNLCYYDSYRDIDASYQYLLVCPYIFLTP